jgi:hypothetical protein
VSLMRRIAAGAALAAGLAVGPSAHAQFSMTDDFGAEINPQPPGHRYHSERYFTAQLTFGPFRPDIDSEFKGMPVARTPYADYFGNDRHLLIQVEAAYEIWQKVGTVSLGLSAGYFSVSGTAPNANHSGPSSDKSTLLVIPVSLSAIYRFDYYLVRDEFPLVPHAKVGLDWNYWQNTDGNGDIADAMGGHGRGGTFGWHAAVGLAVVIDKLDPEAAKDFDTEVGVNHSALVFEFGHYDVSGLGQSNRLHVGDTTWTAGLLFEF